MRYRKISALLLLLLFDLCTAYGQVLDSAYKRQDIRILESYMQQYRCKYTEKPSTLDSLMSTVVKYMRKHNKVKPSQYTLLQSNVLVGNHLGDDFSEVWRKPHKWGEKTDNKKQNYEELSGFVMQSYQCISPKDQVYFVPSFLIKEFDDFLNRDSLLSDTETAKRGRFIDKIVKLTKVAGWLKPSVNVYSSFDIEYAYFNNSKSQVVLRVGFNVSTKEIGESRFVDLLYFSKEKGVWKFSHSRRMAWL